VIIENEAKKDKEKTKKTNYHPQPLERSLQKKNGDTERTKARKALTIIFGVFAFSATPRLGRLMSRRADKVAMQAIKCVVVGMPPGLSGWDVN
jgi:hypothetical protein